MEDVVELVARIESDAADDEEVRAHARELVTDIVSSVHVESAELSTSDDATRDGKPGAASFSVVVIRFVPSALPALMDVIRAWLEHPRSRAVNLSLRIAPSLSRYSDITELAAAIRESLRESERAVKVFEPIPAYEPEAPAASAPPVPTFGDQVDRALAAVAPGRFAFNPPARMRQGEEEHVTVGVVRSRDLDEELRASLRGSGVPEFDDIRTSPLMKVELRGDGAFEIRGESEPEQPVGSAVVTNWEFEVRALRAGNHTLTVSSHWCCRFLATKMFGAAYPC